MLARLLFFNLGVWIYFFKDLRLCPLLLEGTITGKIPMQLRISSNRRQTKCLTLLSIVCLVNLSLLTLSHGFGLGVLDSVLDLVDNLVELVFAKIRQLTLGRKSVEWLDEDFAIAHEVEQLDIFVSGADPHLVVADFVEVVQPVMQPDPQMFVGGIEK